MNKEQKNNKEKVVLFPGVVEKLVTKGMDALKRKKFSDAHSYFDQSLQIEPDHPQARFGLALSLIEQSRLEEAKEITEKMLKEDIGNYFDILQVHISLLVQLGQYNEVVVMLEGIMEEEKLPANLAESLYHLLHFSRQMVDGETKIEMDDEAKKPPNELLHMLNYGSPDKQWLAIQMLGKMPTHVFVDSIKEFLLNDENDPVLKSIILQLLKEKNVEEQIEVHKFGKKYKVNILNLEDVFHEKFGKNTLELVANKLESQNPSLYEAASQVWWHYLFALYPISPEPLNPSIWAAALHKTAVQLFGLEDDVLEIANEYNVDFDEMLSCADTIIKIEQEAFKS